MNEIEKTVCYYRAVFIAGVGREDGETKNIEYLTNHRPMQLLSNVRYWIFLVGYWLFSCSLKAKTITFLYSVQNATSVPRSLRITGTPEPCSWKSAK